MAIWPDDVSTELYYRYNGFVELEIEEIDGLKTIISVTPNIELWNEFNNSNNINAIIYEKQNKLNVLSSICNKTITNGFDIELSNTSGHISLTAEDQINLSNAYATVQNGATQYPYHLDGQLCQMFSAEDITSIAQSATAHKLYHTTYFNHLKAWVERCETINELDSITYGSQLPEDLAANMESIISSV